MQNRLLAVDESNRMAEPLRLKILLAEDNLTNQKLLLRQLQVLGYEADVVSDGAAAVRAVTRSPYDVILMDCQMPTMDGFEATLAIRAWEQQQRTWMPQPLTKAIIIAMTASDLPQDRDRATAVGMNDYLLKPVRHDVLSALLTSWQQVRSNQGVASYYTTNQDSQANQPSDSDQDGTGIAPASLGHLDLAFLHRLSDHSPEFERELLQLFITDSQVHLERLKQAVGQQDFGEIEQQAHHIKGSSANVGAIVMRTAAAHLEAQAVIKQAEPMQPLVDQIEASLQQIQRFCTQQAAISQA